MGIIKATNLEKHYPNPENPLETFAAVNGISLDIESEEIFDGGKPVFRVRRDFGWESEELDRFFELEGILAGNFRS